MASADAIRAALAGQFPNAPRERVARLANSYAQAGLSASAAVEVARAHDALERESLDAEAESDAERIKLALSDLRRLHGEEILDETSEAAAAHRKLLNALDEVEPPAPQEPRTPGPVSDEQAAFADFLAGHGDALAAGTASPEVRARADALELRAREGGTGRPPLTDTQEN